jgi:hypothetical protein
MIKLEFLQIFRKKLILIQNFILLSIFPFNFMFLIFYGVFFYLLDLKKKLLNFFNIFYDVFDIILFNLLYGLFG